MHIDNTLGSLGSIMGTTLIVTKYIKGLPGVKKIPPRLVAIIVGEASTLIFWKAGLLHLDGADPATTIGWFLAGLYGLFAIATSMKGHDFVSDPTTAVKPLNDSK